MMKSKKIIIHAGLHKTGTSSIQSVLSASRALLSEQGILYPSFGENGWENHSVPLALLFMNEGNPGFHSVKKNFPDEDSRSIAQDRVLQDFLLEFIRCGEQNILLSGEDISIFKKNELENLKYFFSNVFDCKFEIIVYVREPVSYVVSGAQEMVRAGIKTLGEAIRIGNLQQVGMKISNLVDVFGTGSIRVFDYGDSGSVGNDVVKHFFSAIGLASPLSMTDMPRANLASSLEKILVLSAVKKLQSSSLARIAQALPDQGSKIILGEASRRMVWNACKADVQFLRDDYGIDYHYTNDDNRYLDASILESRMQIAVQSDGGLSLDSLVSAMVEDVSGVFPELIDGIVGLKH